MKLSVIIPVYKTEIYLKKCLESVLTQDYPNMEIIIINDGSPDDSEKIILDFQKKYSNIVYLKSENKGQAHARNIGLDKATGDLITFIDSDDYILPNMFSKMIGALNNDSSDLVICDMYLEKDKKRTLATGTSFSKLYEAPVSVCNKIFKKELIANAHFLEGVWYEDYNFFIKICLKKPKYTLIQEPFYVYVLHPASTMHNDNAIKNLDIITVTDDLLKRKIAKEIADTIIINHILQDAINRVYNQKSKDKRKVITKLEDYVHEHIKKLSKTESYQNSSKKRKLILKLNYHRLGYISHILLKIKKRRKA